MIEWARHSNGSVQTTIGYMRVELYTPDIGKSWRLATYHWRDSAMNLSRPLRTRDLETAKRRALKYLIEVLTDKRDGIDAWLVQMKEALCPNPNPNGSRVSTSTSSKRNSRSSNRSRSKQPASQRHA